MNGKIIVIDGPDGTGKATTTKRVVELLQQRMPFGDREIRQLSFPNYPNDSQPVNPEYSPYYGRLIRDYLGGDDTCEDRRVPAEIRADPLLASLIYAADRRLAAKSIILPGLANGDVFVLDRYVISNSAHQATKIDDEDEAKDFQRLQQRLEYEILGIPRPHVTFILDLPDDVRDLRIQQRRTEDQAAGGSGQGQVGKTDIHEQDRQHMERATKWYRYIANFDGNILLSCVDNNSQPLSREAVAERVYEQILAQLLGM